MVEDPIGFYNEYALNQPGYSMKELKELRIPIRIA